MNHQTTLVDQIVQALNTRQWPDYVLGEFGSRVGDAVAPYLQPVIGAGVVDGAVTMGGSKIGGLPHVDSDFVWPTEDDTDDPLALVCQINLNEVGTPPLEGMLYLFCIYDSDRAYGYEIDALTAKVVHVAHPGPLTEAARPEGLLDSGVLLERRLLVAPSLLAEELDDDGAPEHKRFDYAVESAIDEELVAHGGAPCDVVRLLGNPHPFREETAEMIADIDDPRLLLYVNGYAVDRHAFGEGEFHLVLSKKDLMTANLDRAEVFFEPGT